MVLVLPAGVLPAAARGRDRGGAGHRGVGGWNRHAYLPFLLYGFLLAADPRFGEAIRRAARAALVVGVSAMLVLLGLGLYLSEVTGQDPAVPMTAGACWRFVKGIGAWAWIVAIVGAATSVVRRARRPAPAGPRQLRPDDPAAGTLRLRGRAIRYANQAVLPVYVLHQTVIVVVGFYVVQWEAPALAKYLVISFTALLVATLVLYDVGVRRTAVTRVLFGIKRASRQGVRART